MLGMVPDHIGGSAHEVGHMRHEKIPFLCNRLLRNGRSCSMKTRNSSRLRWSAQRHLWAIHRGTISGQRHATKAQNLCAPGIQSFISHLLLSKLPSKRFIFPMMKIMLSFQVTRRDLGFGARARVVPPRRNAVVHHSLLAIAHPIRAPVVCLLASFWIVRPWGSGWCRFGWLRGRRY